MAFGHAYLQGPERYARLLLAFVLEPIIEQNFNRALQVAYGDPMVFIPLKDAQEAQFLKDNDAIRQRVEEVKAARSARGQRQGQRRAG